MHRAIPVSGVDKAPILAASSPAAMWRHGGALQQAPLHLRGCFQRPLRLQ